MYSLLSNTNSIYLFIVYVLNNIHICYISSIVFITFILTVNVQSSQVEDDDIEEEEIVSELLIEETPSPPMEDDEISPDNPPMEGRYLYIVLLCII